MAGESLGGETQPYLQVLPSPYLSLWSGCHWQPPCPLGSLPCPHLAHAFYCQETCTHFNPRAGASGARVDQQKRGEALFTSPASTEQSHGFRYLPPVLFLLQPQFHQVSGLHEGLGQGEGSGQGP